MKKNIILFALMFVLCSFHSLNAQQRSRAEMLKEMKETENRINEIDERIEQLDDSIRHHSKVHDDALAARNNRLAHQAATICTNNQNEKITLQSERNQLEKKLFRLRRELGLSPQIQNKNQIRRDIKNSVKRLKEIDERIVQLDDSIKHHTQVHNDALAARNYRLAKQASTISQNSENEKNILLREKANILEKMKILRRQLSKSR